ncbi:diadenylate cyclase [Natronorarus salvus]|uniref:diadenylate cyclase n=1 Tax=Natronorarus salvus TaxID=3117733 RepID=UPI002F25F5E8
MTHSDGLSIEYERHGGVRELIDAVQYCLEGLSLDFGAHDDPHVKGPGAYLAVVSGRRIANHAARYRWPVEESTVPLSDLDTFYTTLSEVALTRDGAVVLSVDGVVQERMVRFRDRPEPGTEYADWMGSRHMSALDTSRRDSVVATLTLSQETGRVTLFRDGGFESVERERIAARWRSEDDQSV